MGTLSRGRREAREGRRTVDQCQALLLDPPKKLLLPQGKVPAEE